MTLELEEKLVELEVRFSFQEQALESLSDELIHQNQLIDRMQRKISQLEKKLDESGADQPEIVDQRPPHY